MANYFIYDCTGKVVGNPNGYRTFRGANQQANSIKSKVCQQLWATYYEYKQENPDNNLVNRIGQGA